MAEPSGDRHPRWDTPTQPWVPSAKDHPVWSRSLLLEVTVRAVFPTVVLVSLYLLFAGHHGPGGGFAGGLLAGLAFVLRYLVGGAAELAATISVRPMVLVATGLSVVTIVALVPLVLGHPPLTSGEVSWYVPVIGTVKLASNVMFDIGIYLLVTGGVLDLLRTLGAGVQTDRPGEPGEGGRR